MYVLHYYKDMHNMHNRIAEISCLQIAVEKSTNVSKRGHFQMKDII